MIIPPDTFLTSHFKLIVELAARYRVPAIYPFPYFATAGGLVSYGPDLVESVKHTTQDEFNEVVVNGRTNVNAAERPAKPPPTTATSKLASRDMRPPCRPAATGATNLAEMAKSQ